MKRKIYRITSTAGHSAERYAWNAAMREMNAMMRQHAYLRGETWYRGASKLERGADGKPTFARGEFPWSGPDGQTVTFTITREE